MTQGRQALKSEQDILKSQQMKNRAGPHEGQAVFQRFDPNFVILSSVTLC